MSANADVAGRVRHLDPAKDPYLAMPRPPLQVVDDVRQFRLKWRYAQGNGPPDVWTDRAICLGTTGTGKSTLAENLIEDALRRYKELRVMILDSKPRFRAEWEVNGLSAAPRYRRWAHGAKVIPDSFALPLQDAAKALPDVWKFDGRVAIAQAPNGAEDKLQLFQLLEAASAFFDETSADVPHLLYIDEVMDFFHMNGAPIGRKMTIIQCARAGRELGLGLVCSTQRPRGIPAQLLQEANMMYLFWLRNVDDVARLDDFGLPHAEEWMPRKNNKQFYFYDHEHPMKAGMYKLRL